jgi:hypothetical protein
MADASRTLPAATSAIAGGLAVAASVAAELIHPVQNSDGTSREPLLHAVYLIAWIVGWILVALAALKLRRLVAGHGRKGAIGSWLVFGGSVALATSAVGQLIGIAAGVYLEALFILFVVGLPLVAIGCALLGSAPRETAGTAWIFLLVAAAGFLVAFLADTDPIHDIGLIGGAVAIAAAGLALRTTDGAIHVSSKV